MHTTYRNTSILLILLFIAFGNIISQPLTKIPFQAHLEKAAEYAEQNNYYSQLEELEEAYKQKRDFSLIPIMADLNYKLRDYARAENYYKRIVDRDKDGKNIEALYKYGKMIKMNGRYDEALPILNQVTNSGEEPWSTLSQLAVAGIEMARKTDSIPDLSVAPASKQINTRSGEYSPAIQENTLYYTSANRSAKDELNDVYPVNVYKSIRSEDGVWSKPDLASANLAAAAPVIGNVAIEKNSGTMFLTKAGLKGEEVEYSRIYFSRPEGGEWSEPVKVEGLFDSAIVKNPMPGELYGKEVLFFSSNAPGGQGGFDLYYATKISEGKYDSPVNMGQSINTAQDEITPYYKDGFLVYSSDGLPSYGGLDLFWSEWNGSSWSSPLNMGPGYNSYADDMYFTIDDEGYQGFIVSNREGTISSRSKTCCDDIFQFNIRKPVISTDIFVLDENKPLRGSNFTITDLSKPQEATTEVGEKEYRYQYDLELNKEYLIKVTKPGYYPDSIYIRTNDIGIDTTLTRKINMKPKPEVIVVTLNEPIRLNNIYYDYNDAKILPESEPDLNYLYDIMMEYPTIVIELSSHTDARGGDDFNLKLSQRRAESARNYLIAKGITPERIVAVGYGETQILNKCVNGVKCTDDEHRFNRRTEFKIISGPTSIEIKKQEVRERGKVIKSETIKGK